MSVILENKNGWIVDHRKLINKFYNEYRSADGKGVVLNPNCFSVYFSFYMESQLDKYIKNSEKQCHSVQHVAEALKLDMEQKSKKRKRKRSNSTSNELLGHENKIQLLIRTAAEELIEFGRNKGAFSQPPTDLESVRNTEARKLSRKVHNLSDQFSTLYCNSIKNGEAIFPSLENNGDFSVIGENYIAYNSKHPCLVTIKGQEFLIPPQCQFLNSDIDDVSALLQLGNKMYDFIVIDPPWGNRSIKRRRGYDWLDNDDLRKLPISVLANEGAIVVVWVTNNPHHMAFIENELFPAWSVKLCAVWHWLKVTTSGDLICDWDFHTKKPYEHLYIGQKVDVLSSSTLIIDNSKIIVSIPSAISSHKPPLTEIFRNFVKPDGNCLELFARSLLPQWTSWGNQVILLQNVELFNSVV